MREASVVAVVVGAAWRVCLLRLEFDRRPRRSVWLWGRVYDRVSIWPRLVVAVVGVVVERVCR